MIDLTVSSKKISQYNIISGDSFENLTERLSDLFPSAGKACIISDSNVAPLYLEEVTKNIPDNIEVLSFVIEAGEDSKRLETVESILKFLLDNSFLRKDFLIALGGGVTGDITGFAASLYMRGISFVMIPTSLLAMADSSIGGKTAVDFGGIKNIVGAFNMPSLIYLNFNVLNTLPDREYYAGFAEIMKAGLLYDSKFYMWLIENMYEICDKNIETVSEMLEHAIGIKKAIVEKDPFENGDRALLNLGHTIGHAIEVTSNGEYIHGECVALGCVAAAFISWKMDMISMEDYYEVRDMFVPFNLPISIVRDDLQPILDALKKDKKNTSGNVNMVLLKKIGKAVLVKGISDELIVAALDELNFKDED